MQFSGGPRIAPSAAVVRLILTLAGRAVSVPDKDRMRTLSSGTLSIGRVPATTGCCPTPTAIYPRRIAPSPSMPVIHADGPQHERHLRQSRPAGHRARQHNRATDGDEFRLGDYVISVAAAEDGPALAADSTSAGDARGPLDADPLDDPFGRRPNPAFLHPAAAAPVNRRGADLSTATANARAMWPARMMIYFAASCPHPTGRAPRDRITFARPPRRCRRRA